MKAISLSNKSCALKNNLKFPSLVFAVLFLGLFFSFSGKANAAIYYVDSSVADTHVASATPDFTTYNHNDFTTGSGTDSVFKTIADINVFAALTSDDQILFRRGQSWREQLIVPSSGSEDHPITFGAYGDSGDPKPIFMASNSKNTTGDWASNTTTVTYNVSQTSDDKETIPSWSVIGDEESLGKRSDGPALRNGFRFQNAAIPQNATIVSAYIKLYGSNQAPAWGDPESASPVNVRIKGQASDTTATFSTYADFAGRSETTAYVDWSNIPVFTNNTQFSSPNISSVVQETVNRSGWSSGNSMVIFLDDNGSTAGVIRDYKDYGEDSARPASITIIYLDPSTNVWSTPISPNSDVGSILADSTVLTGKKSTLGALASQGDFYYDSSAGYLYLYSTSNPATYYNGSIEAWYKGSTASNGNIIYVANKNYININNLNIKYGGGHGIQTSNVTGITIENNTVSYVGGSYLTGTTRYGNGIELWDGASDVTVQNNSVSQTFDEGLTAQYDSAITQNNIIFQDNTVDKCGRGMAHSSFGAPGATLSNFYWRRNTFTDNGLGWAVPGISNGEGKGAQLNISDTMTNANFTDNIIRNTASGADPNGQGILVIGGSWNVSRNWIENAHNSSIRVYGDPTLTVANNIIVDPNTKPCMFFHGNDSNANATNVYNNTCFASDNSNTNLIVFGANGGFGVTNINFKNNIVLNTGTNTSALVYVSTVSTPALDNNLYYRNTFGNLIAWSNGTTYTQAEWSNYKIASSQDINSSTPNNPLFTDQNNADFTLQTTSPAIDSGADLGDSYDDGLDPNSTWPDAVTTLDQDNYGSGWEIGAYVYEETDAPTFTVNLSTDSGPVKTDTINVTVADDSLITTREYGYSPDVTCNGSDTYGNPFTSDEDFDISENHTNYLCVMATDEYSNTGYHFVGQLNTDNAAPNTNINSGPDDPTNTDSASFTFSSTESISTFECKLDSGSYSSCTSPKDYTSLIDGDHTFYVRATDEAGNTDATVASYAWAIDTAGPSTTIDSNPDDPTNSTSATFTFSSNDETATFQCKLDDGSYSTCASPKNYTDQTDGDHTFYVKAIDSLDNEDPTPAEYSWTIDTAAPSTTIDSHPDASTTSTSATFEFSSDDENAILWCKLDDADYAICTSPQNFTGLVLGDHTFSVKAIDEENNEDPSPATFSWIITLTPAPADNNTQEDNYDKLDISKVKYSIINDNQIKITFKTNNNSKGTAQYGIDKNLKQKEKESKNKKQHTINLKNLALGIEYYFRISAKDTHDQSERTKIYSVTLPKAVAYAPRINKVTPKSQATIPINQNQENQNNPAPQNSNQIQNYTDKNTDTAPNNSSSNNSPSPQPQSQSSTFKWWNPFTWFQSSTFHWYNPFSWF